MDERPAVTRLPGPVLARTLRQDHGLHTASPQPVSSRPPRAPRHAAVYCQKPWSKSAKRPPATLFMMLAEPATASTATSGPRYGNGRRPSGNSGFRMRSPQVDRLANNSPFHFFISYGIVLYPSIPRGQGRATEQSRVLQHVYHVGQAPQLSSLSRVLYLAAPHQHSRWTEQQWEIYNSERFSYSRTSNTSSTVSSPFACFNSRWS